MQAGSWHSAWLSRDARHMLCSARCLNSPLNGSPPILSLQVSSPGLILLSLCTLVLQLLKHLFGLKGPYDSFHLQHLLSPDSFACLYATAAALCLSCTEHSISFRGGNSLFLYSWSSVRLEWGLPKVIT